MKKLSLFFVILAIAGGALADIVVTPLIGGSGTVTSVGVSVPSQFSIAGTPITSSGTIAISQATQAANLFFAGPTSGAAAVPTFRAFTDADFPTTLNLSIASLAVTSQSDGIAVAVRRYGAAQASYVQEWQTEVNGFMSGIDKDGNFVGNVTGNVSGNAGTATALAANPADCAAGNFATAIAANGDLTCSADAVSSVAGRTGAVTLTAADVAAGTFPAGAFVFTTSPSSPATGTSNEIWGAGATTTGSYSVVVGPSATGAGATGGVAIGYSADHGGTGVAVGVTASGLGTNSTAVGQATVANVQESTAVGGTAHTTGIGGTAVGSDAGVSGLVGVAIGYHPVVAHDASIGLGGLATTTATNQMVIGSTTYPITEQRVVTSTNGTYWSRGASSEAITLSLVGATSDSVANLLPANSLIEAVTCRVTTTITGATDWSVGDPTTAARFSSANATLTAGTTSVGLNHQQGSVATDAAGPVQTSAAKLRITTTGTATAGVIRCTTFWQTFVPPTS